MINRKQSIVYSIAILAAFLYVLYFVRRAANPSLPLSGEVMQKAQKPDEKLKSKGIISNGVVEFNGADEVTERSMLSELSRAHLTNRYSLLNKVAIVGGDSSARVLIDQLTENYGGKELPLIECNALLRTLRCLGYVSERSEIALNFLREHTDPASWSAESIWMDSGFRTHSEYQLYLAGAALSALAAGGRGEMWDEIRRIQQLEMPPEVAERWGARFLTAVHNEYLRRQIGPQATLELSTDEYLDSFQKWWTKNTDHPIVKWYEIQKQSIKP